jgi:outer membrane protein OmpA-like peptidoglycan-associated protein
LLAPSAGAQALSASAAGGGALAVSEPHASEFGPGGWVAGQVGARVAPGLVLGASALGLGLSSGKGGDARYQSGTGASLFALAFDLRARPWADPDVDEPGYPHGLWVGGGAGAAVTGGVTRLTLAGHVGYDFWLGPRFGLGPTASAVYVVQPDADVRPEDALVALVGARVVFEAAEVAVPRALRAIVDRGASDRDGDEVDDRVDRCPDAAEDRDGKDDNDGCPEDDDGDGVPDVADACRAVPEDRDGYQDDDGCPEPDNDFDGVSDGGDRCPNEPEDKDGFQDDDGCPDPDNDGDGVADGADRCPREAEVKNGKADDDGCPDDVSLRVEGDEVVLDERLGFVPDVAAVRKSSWGVLDQLAKLLVQYPQYETLIIEAYADAPGGAGEDRAFSEARAEAVRRRLSSAGVEPDRLVARGRGPSRARKGKSDTKSRAERGELTLRLVRHGAPGGAPPAGRAR